MRVFSRRLRPSNITRCRATARCAHGPKNSEWLTRPGFCRRSLTKRKQRIPRLPSLPNPSSTSKPSRNWRPETEVATRRRPPTPRWLFTPPADELSCRPREWTMTDIKEHMEIIGADGVHVGTVDKIEGNRIKLTKKDSGEGSHKGHHHYIDRGLVAGVEGNKVRLSASGAVAVTMEEEKKICRGHR